ncbi:MAG: FRG domain-containing protein [Rhodoferax sp.]|nr:FRG domain-containing protein [Rhodoferax sp.]
MYNLLVTSQQGAWDDGVYSFDRGRFLEFTTDEIAARFRDLKDKQITVLCHLPSLFMYEGSTEPVRLGKLTTLEVRGRLLRIKFEFDANVDPIPFEAIAPIQQLLDIRSWEMNRTHWAVKDEDLLQHLKQRNLLPAQATPNSRVHVLPPVAIDLQASSVGEFIKVVLSQPHDDKEIFYRGHSKSTYRLEPSLFRKDGKGNYLYRNAEDRLYRELLVSNSPDFESDIYTLDRLVRMQHFSMPTRLLDISSNPLIALYFACKSHLDPETPAEVVIFTVDQAQMKYFDSDTASCVANLARLTGADKAGIDFSITAKVKFNKQPSVKRLLHFVKEEKSFFEPRILPSDLQSVLCIKGKRNNSRITFQSGAFLLFGHDAVLSETGTPEIGVKRIAITSKEKILGELDQLNINESTVFPYIENSARYIANKHSFKPPSI